MPECLNDLTIQHSRAWNEGRCVSCITFLNMSMDMEKAYTALNGDVIVEFDEVFDSVCSGEEVGPVLAHNIVEK